MRTRVETEKERGATKTGTMRGEDAFVAARLEKLEAIAGNARAAEIAHRDTVAHEQVMTRIDEGFSLLIGCALHFSALAAEGLTEGETRRFRALLDALTSAEALRMLAEGFSDAAACHAETVRTRLYDAVGDAAGRLRARAAFTFRYDPDDARRRVFSSAYTPRLENRGRCVRSMSDAVELKLR
jgi:hypothetical protein